jgi:GTP-binding protein HflX
VEDVRLLYPKALFVSAATGQNLDQLRHTLAQFATALSPNPFDWQEPKDP